MGSADDQTPDDDQPEVALRGKGQADRLAKQHEQAGGPVGIFGEAAQKHDLSIRKVSDLVLKGLQATYPGLSFRIRSTLSKSEINAKLSEIDPVLGRVLFVDKSSIKPDGGVIEVQDKNDAWRVILVGESKHQGNDVEKIKAGIKQGKNKQDDLMVAGNAIERVHKNISEIRNYRLDEDHFPYVVFLQGSNFATETFYVKTPNGRKVEISHKTGTLNRIDRVTANSFGMAINQNYCRNTFVDRRDTRQMLQVASLYFQCDSWKPQEMARIMWDIATTSLNVLSGDLDVGKSR